MASFFQGEGAVPSGNVEFDAMYPEGPPMPASRPSKRLESLDLSPLRVGIDVPFSIGRGQ